MRVICEGVDVVLESPKRVRISLLSQQKAFVRNRMAAVVEEGIDCLCHAGTDVYTNVSHARKGITVLAPHAVALLPVALNPLTYRSGSLLCGTTLVSTSKGCRDGFVQVTSTAPHQTVCLFSPSSSVVPFVVEGRQLLQLARVVAFEGSFSLSSPPSSFQRPQPLPYIAFCGSGTVWMSALP